MTDLYIHIYSYIHQICTSKVKKDVFFIILVLRNDSSFVATPTINTFELTIDCYYYSKWHHAHLVF